MFLALFSTDPLNTENVWYSGNTVRGRLLRQINLSQTLTTAHFKLFSLMASLRTAS